MKTSAVGNGVGLILFNEEIFLKRLTGLEYIKRKSNIINNRGVKPHQIWQGVSELKEH